MGDPRERVMKQLAINHQSGHEMHAFVGRLFPICRSLTGNGVRQTLKSVGEHLPGLNTYEIPSGTKAFDWTVPDEWNIQSATLTGPSGETIADFNDNNLHVVGYSTPVDAEFSLEELQPHLYSLPHLPDAVPYVTSYYARRWGFCLPHNTRESLKPGNYRARIDSILAPGHLTLGELILPGAEEREILLSTYICHPSMANNELSGIAVTVWLAKWLMQKKRRYTYRILFVPETIGSIVYLSNHLEQMKSATIAGFNITCVGDDRCFSFLESRRANTLPDRVAKHVLSHIAPDYVRYTFRDRGSDERQYCSPGVDLPVCSIMRSKYGEYPEYHTSRDDMSLVTPSGLAGALEALRLCLVCLENNEVPMAQVLCEPQLGKYQLYPTISGAKPLDESVRHMMDLLAYSDGEQDLLSIAEIIGVPLWELLPVVSQLKSHALLARHEAQEVRCRQGDTS